MSKDIKLYIPGTDIEVRPKLDSDTGQTIFTYFYKGRSCPSITFESKQARQVARHQLIYKDLEIVQKLLSYLINGFPEMPDHLISAKLGVINQRLDDINDLTRISMYTTAVINYAKCFTSASGRKVKLEHLVVLKSEEEHIKDMHSNIMEQRHQYIAHGGKTEMEQSKTLLLLDPFGDNGFEPYLTTHASYRASLYLDEYEAFNQLVQVVMRHTRSKIKKMLDALWDKEIAVHDNSELYRMAENSNVK